MVFLGCYIGTKVGPKSFQNYPWAIKVVDNNCYIYVQYFPGPKEGHCFAISLYKREIRLQGITNSVPNTQPRNKIQCAATKINDMSISFCISACLHVYLTYAFIGSYMVR